jgi:type IV secretory pathway component VirB8
MFYNYLRNDDYYKNTRQYSSDKPNESYMIKGERDNKKIFVIVWVIFILILAAISMWLYSFNNGLI